MTQLTTTTNGLIEVCIVRLFIHTRVGDIQSFSPHRTDHAPRPGLWSFPGSTEFQVDSDYLRGDSCTDTRDLLQSGRTRRRPSGVLEWSSTTEEMSRRRRRPTGRKRSYSVNSLCLSLLRVGSTFGVRKVVDETPDYRVVRTPSGRESSLSDTGRVWTPT